MKMLKSITLSVLSMVLLLSACNEQQMQVNTDYSGEIERTYIAPTQIIWQSENAEIVNTERLLKEGIHQALLINSDVCTLKNSKEQASIILDFGKELHGGLEIVTGMWPGGKPVHVRVRFGESVSETMADIGGKPGATNDHAIRDWELKLPWLRKG